MKFIIVLFFIVNILYAKKDFYYSFIDSNGEQISEERKQTITDGFDILQNARILARDDRIDDAFAQVKSFKESNKIKVLSSDTMILYADLALKKKSKKVDA